MSSSAPSTATAETLQVDVAIVGGGLVGASLALALAQVDLKVALIEAHPWNSQAQQSFDDRTTALSNGSRRIFEGLDVWPLVERDATPAVRAVLGSGPRIPRVFPVVRNGVENPKLLAGRDIVGGDVAQIVCDNNGILEDCWRNADFAGHDSAMIAEVRTGLAGFWIERV